MTETIQPTSIRFLPAEKAPAGWEFVDDESGAFGYSTWLDADGKIVAVPTRYDDCPYCDGTGEDFDGDDEDDYRECGECNGEGVDYDTSAFDFGGAVSKPSLLTLRKGIVLAGYQWWKGQP